jgi:hypothetical protein
MTDVTAPYALDSLELVRRSHRQEFRAEAITAAAGTVALQVSGGTLTFSEDYSPRAQGSLSCATVTASQLAALDPRAGVPVRIYAGYVVPGKADDVQLLAELRLADRATQQPGDVLELVLASAESLTHEVKWAQPAQVKAFGSVQDAVTWLVSYAAGAAVTIQHALPAAYRNDLTGAVSLTPGLSMWEAAYSLAAAAALQLYVDSTGAWRLEPLPSVAGETAAFLLPGAGSPLSKATDVLSRDGYYEAAVITFKWKDASGAKETVGIWAPTPGTGQEAGAGHRTFTAERPGPMAQGSANEAARLAVQQLSTRGNSYTLEAVAHYWLRPGHTVQIQAANGDVLRHLVKTVSFNLAEGSMTVTTREPSNLGA